MTGGRTAAASKGPLLRENRVAADLAGWVHVAVSDLVGVVPYLSWRENRS